MTTNKPSKQSTGAAAKYLIAAASLTAVVGGWAVFSSKDPSLNTTAVAALELTLSPLPTLVAPPIQLQDAPSIMLPNNQPSAPILRSVTIPGPVANAAPQPVTNTQSSH